MQLIHLSFQFKQPADLYIWHSEEKSKQTKTELLKNRFVSVFVSVCVVIVSQRERQKGRGAREEIETFTENTKRMKATENEWMNECPVPVASFFVDLLQKIETPLSAFELSLSLHVSNCVAEWVFVACERA